jgi:hypothetical protein
MAFVVGRYQIPSLPVSITDGVTQVTFGTPSDFQDWLVHREHRGEQPDLTKWSWTLPDPKFGE